MIFDIFIFMFTSKFPRQSFNYRLNIKENISDMLFPRQRNIREFVWIFSVYTVEIFTNFQLSVLFNLSKNMYKDSDMVSSSAA